jgi:hypothetical protein
MKLSHCADTAVAMAPFQYSLLQFLVLLLWELDSCLAHGNRFVLADRRNYCTKRQPPVWT